jgi:hypothetical protein
MHERPILVISSGARDLAFSATYEEKISRLWLEMGQLRHTLQRGRRKEAPARKESRSHEGGMRDYPSSLLPLGEERNRV